MSFEILPLSQNSQYRDRFLAAGSALRHGVCAVNAPSAAYTGFVLSTVAEDRREAWVAVSSGGGEQKVFGRIAAFDQKQATLGLFEVDVERKESPQIAAGLIGAASEWLKARGRKQFYGPIDGSTWFQYRLRDYRSFPPPENYRWEPTTPPEYLRFFEQSGFAEVERYYSYGYEGSRRFGLPLAAKLLASSYRFGKKQGFRFVPLLEERTPEKMEALLSSLYAMSTEGFSGNFLYEPVSEPVFKQLYGSVMRDVDLGFSFRVVAPDGRDAGFIFAFEDQETLVIKSIAVRSEFRGKKLSSGLLHLAMKAMADRGGVNRVVSALVKTGSASEFLGDRYFAFGLKTWRQRYVLYGYGDTTAMEQVKKRNGSAVPGPRGMQIIDRISARRKSAVDFYLGLQESYGDVVKLPLGISSFFILSDPDAVKQVLLDRYRDYRKGPGFDRLALVIGKGLITSEGELWKKQRRTIHPTFTRERLSDFSQLMGQIALRWLEQWKDGIEIDLASALNELSLDVVSETLLGSDMREESRKVGKAFSEVLDYYDKMLISPARFLELLPKWKPVEWLKGGIRALPTAENRKFRAALAELNSVVDAVIDRRTQQAKLGGAVNLVSVLLEARDEETGEAMSRQQLRDEVMTILLAGHETTANALIWTWILLSKSPEARAAFHREVDSSEVGKVVGSFSLDRMAALKYTQACFEESMRLYPPVWRMTRQAVVDTEVAGYKVPKGSMIAIAQYLLHRHPKYWGSDSHRFRPERFLDQADNKARHRFSFIPFGAGPRICIGSHFASLEAQIILATIGSRFDILVDDPDSIELDPKITLRPKGRISARVVARR